MVAALFHELQMPHRIAFGSSGGPERRTEIAQLASGYEQRNSPWAQSRRRYNIAAGPRPIAELYSLIDFFEARHGRLYGFRWHDWLDHQSATPGRAISPLDQPCRELGTGRRYFLLEKIYGTGTHTATRRIHKPVANTVVVAVGGRTLSKTAYTVDNTTGKITLQTAASKGSKVTAGFKFDVPVRFDSDQLDIQFTSPESGSINNIPLIELRLAEVTA